MLDPQIIRDLLYVAGLLLVWFGRRARTEGSIASSVLTLATALNDEGKRHAAQQDKTLTEMAAQRLHTETIVENNRVLNEARIRQFDKSLTIQGVQAETLDTLTEGQTRHGLVLDKQSLSLAAIREQGVKLEDLPNEIALLKLRLDTLPTGVRTALADDFKTLSTKIDAALLTHAPINNTINVAPESATKVDAQKPATPQPTSVPEMNAATQQLGDTLKSAEADDTLVVRGGMPNGQAVTP